MSYIQNITRTLVGLAMTQTRQSTWAVNRKHSKVKCQDKLQKYLMRASGSVFDISRDPNALGATIGWAGNKTKSTMLKEKTRFPRKQMPKVFRQTIPARMYRYRFMTLVNMCAVPQFPSTGLTSDDFDHVIWVRNKRVGELIFVKADGSSVTVPYAENIDATEPEFSAAWSLLTRLDSNGNQIPLIPARRRIPVTE